MRNSGLSGKEWKTKNLGKSDRKEEKNVAEVELELDREKTSVNHQTQPGSFDDCESSLLLN